jgi:hypothetical protein
MTDVVNEEDEGPKIKERLLALSLKYLDVCCVWDCSPYWVSFQRLISLFVYDAFIELFITLCIVVNTLFMALDHHGMNEEMSRALKMGNYVISTLVFVFILVILEGFSLGFHLIVLHGHFRH